MSWPTVCGPPLNLAHRYGVGLGHAFRRAIDDLKKLDPRPTAR
ncbi:hypothetical protein OG698_01440 [Streptomyces sp. NBC_01003]|nr:hypothetical protein OG698_01440 [Streptomyces sp. NBC_01003]